MCSIVLEDNSNSLRYWIYTLIIYTYCMNKRGFDCAPLCAFFRRFSVSLPHFPLFFLHITQASCAVFFLSCTLSILEPLTFGIHLAYQSFFYTTTPREPVEVSPKKTNFYSTWFFDMSKNLHNNLHKYLLHAARMLHAARKHTSHLWVLGE